MVDILKSTGQAEQFSEEKYYNSMRSAGIEHSLAQEVLRMVTHDANNLASTQKLHSTTEDILLKKGHYGFAARYHLQRAIMALGPSGFPFEQYIARVFQAYGYTTTTNRVISGKCVRHEIDVVAQRDNRHFMIECKHHHFTGAKTDVKVALYVYARFLDIKQAWEHAEKKELPEIHAPWLVTNTKLTTDAIQYAECVGMKLLGWHYPAKESLNYYIESKGLYPITALAFLTPSQKANLMQHNIILVRDGLNYSANQLHELTRLPEKTIAQLQVAAKDLQLL